MAPITKGNSKESGKPITERRNEMTEDIDVAKPEEIVRLLRTCDSQLFNGYQSFPSLLDSEIEEAVEAVTDIAGEFLASSQETCVVLAGAGTSGRLAFQMALSFNNLLSQHGFSPCFHALIAGGEKALLQAQEGAEDNAEAAVEDLIAVEKARGLASQPFRRILYYAITRVHFASVLIGFNPVHMARKTRVSGFGNSFWEIAHELSRQANAICPNGQRHFVITPVVGPEAICGSTRLKGGTATKILLEIIFGRAIGRLLRLPMLGSEPVTLFMEPKSGKSGSEGWRQKQKQKETESIPYRRAVGAYEGVYRAVYNCSNEIGQLVSMAGESLQEGGRVLYVGAGSSGLMAVIDASEQPPTFGATLEDVQAFVYGGWPEMKSTASMKSSTNGGIITGTHVTGSHTFLEGESGLVTDTVVGDGDKKWGVEGEETEEYLDKNSFENNVNGHFRTSDEGKTEMENKGLFESITFETLVKKVLPKTRHTDTLIIVEGSHSGYPLPPSFLTAIIARKMRPGLRVALVDFSIESHDRVFCTYYENLQKPRKPNLSTQSEDDSKLNLKTWSETLFSANVVDHSIHIELPAIAAAPLVQGAHFFWEIAVKYVLNAVSTGAHVLIGKVYHSLMVDLKISNVKLYHRAVSIVSTLIGVSTESATEAILEAIYGSVLDLTSPWAKKTMLSKSIREHVATAGKLQKVVPMALLIATNRYTFQEATESLRRGQIRNLVTSACQAN